MKIIIERIAMKKDDGKEQIRQKILFNQIQDLKGN